MTTPWDTGDQIRRLFLAGRPECRDFLLAELADTTQEGEATHTAKIDGKEVQEPIFKGRMIAEIVCQWRKDDFQIDEESPNVDQIKKRQELATWLKAQFALIQQGKAPDMKTDLSSGNSEWHVDAP